MLKTDNGPQFGSSEFKKLMEEYSVRHITSSPYHHESNGHAESAGVKNAKRIIKLHPVGSDDYWKALQAVRNAPSRSRGETPAHMVLGKSLRTGQWPESVEESELPPAAARARQALEQEQANDRPMSAAQFNVGDRVLVQDPELKTWNDRGVIIGVDSDRRVFDLFSITALIFVCLNYCRTNYAIKTNKFSEVGKRLVAREQMLRR